MLVLMGRSYLVQRRLHRDSFQYSTDTAHRGAASGLNWSIPAEARITRREFAALVDVAVWYRAMNTAISSNPEIMGGTPCLAGTRVPFQTLLDYLVGGDSLDEFLEDFPSVSRECAVAAIQQAGDLALAHVCVA
jgi:uncharacterized protein (DUF433 family)